MPHDVLPMQVPIIGEARKPTVHDVQMTALVQCSCAPDAPPFLIASVDRNGRCPRCKAEFAIGEIKYAREPEMSLYIKVGQLQRATTALQ